ncbi:MAG: acetyltransferase [Rhodothermaceae bacterium]|nr:acetyltransferase [Rhodothermaceae bacterium]
MANTLPDRATSIKLAEAIRSECLKAARDAFTDASESGLCEEGAIEAALGAIQSVDTERIISRILNKTQLLQ